MKKYFIMFLNFLTSLFKSKKVEIPQVKDVQEEVKPAPVRVKLTDQIGIRSYPKHNNRKHTLGRRVQIHYAQGSSKPIYHSNM